MRIPGILSQGFGSELGDLPRRHTACRLRLGGLDCSESPSSPA